MWRGQGWQSSIFAHSWLHGHSLNKDLLNRTFKFSALLQGTGIP